MQVPEVMPVMNEINKTFEDECSWQFITNRWNCTGVRSPIYIDSELEGTYLQEPCKHVYTYDHDDIYKSTDTCPLLQW